MKSQHKIRYALAAAVVAMAAWQYAQYLRGRTSGPLPRDPAVQGPTVSPFGPVHGGVVVQQPAAVPASQPQQPAPGPDQAAAQQEARIKQLAAQIEGQPGRRTDFDQPESQAPIEDQKKIQEFKERALVIQQEWEAQPEAQRDRQQLRDRLNALRREVLSRP